MANVKLSQITAAGAAPATTDQIVAVTGGVTDNLYTVGNVETRLATDGWLKTYVSTSDPTVSNDNTQGYSVGSKGINSGTGRVFNCRDATTGAAVWDLIGPQQHPGFIASNWIALSNCSNGASPAPVAATQYFTPFILPHRCTISTLSNRITTLGTSNFQMSIYSNLTGRPKSLQSSTSTANTVNTATGQITSALNASIQLEPGIYWAGIQQNDTTVRYTAVLSAGLPLMPLIIGSATVGNVAPAGANITGVSTTSNAYGTWPADISASTWSEVTSASLTPYILALISSVP